MFSKYYKYVFIVSIIFIFILLINTDSGKNYANYITSAFNKDYTDLTNSLEEERKKFEKQSETYKVLYEDLQNENKLLVSERKQLKVKINNLSVELKNIQEKKNSIDIPKDIYEASKTLNNLGYTNTIRNCQ